MPNHLYFRYIYTSKPHQFITPGVSISHENKEKERYTPQKYNQGKGPLKRNKYLHCDKSRLIERRYTQCKNK